MMADTPEDTPVDGPPIDDVDGPPLDDVDGPPLDDVDGPPLDDVDGPPLEDVDGPPLDGVDGPSQRSQEVTPQSIDTPSQVQREETSEEPAPPETPTLVKRDSELSRRESTVDDNLEGDQVFDVQLSEIVERKSTVSSMTTDTTITEDVNQVNVHQFYPMLEHQFLKGHTTFVDDQGDQSQRAIKEMVDEDTGLKPDSRGSQMALVPSTVSTGTPWSKEDENNSSDPHKSQLTAPSNDQQPGTSAADAGVFSTAVDEKTLEEAKARQSQSIFQTEKWGNDKPSQPSMKYIMEQTADKHFNKAMELRDEDNYISAILHLNKALGIRREDIDFFRERAEAYIRLCDFQSAILNYKKVCLLDPSNEEYYNRLSFLYYFQGQSLFDQRLYPEALESFSRAAEMRPDNVGYHIRSITCLAALQRHGECLALVNKRLETDKENADLYVMRARLHEMFRNTTLCYYDVKDALGLNPGHPEATRMMEKLQKVAQDNKRNAMQLNLTGKHREALQKISIAIETDPAVADFHVLRGALHRKLGDFNAAIDDFLLALDKCDHVEESPVYIDSQRQLLLTYNDFAVECFTKAFYEEAIILLNKAIKGEKREKGLYINRGDCFFRQEEFDFAMQDYQQALEIDEADETIKSRISVIHNEFGVHAYQDKMFAEAETRFTQALEFHPKIGQYYISRARARYMLENMTGARGDLLMGLLLDPTNEDVISILSRLFPGKSVGDILNSRAAESAKLAIRSIFEVARPQVEENGGLERDASFVSDRSDTSSKKSEHESADDEITSQENQSANSVESAEPVWHPNKVSDFKIMMDEQEFNIKLVELKQGVNTKVKSALFDRKSLRHGGPRLQPLPPPKPKPPGGRRKDTMMGAQAKMVKSHRRLLPKIGEVDKLALINYTVEDYDIL